MKKVERIKWFVWRRPDGSSHLARAGDKTHEEMAARDESLRGAHLDCALVATQDEAAHYHKTGVAMPGVLRRPNGLYEKGARKSEASRIRWALEQWVENGIVDQLRIVAETHRRYGERRESAGRGWKVEAALAKVLKGLAELTEALNEIDDPPSKRPDWGDIEK